MIILSRGVTRRALLCTLEPEHSSDLTVICLIFVCVGAVCSKAPNLQLQLRTNSGYPTTLNCHESPSHHGFTGGRRGP